MMSSRFVIIGGGMAGQAIAKELLKQAVTSVTIVQANSFTEVPFLMPYMLTRPELFESTANTKKGFVHSIERVSIPNVKYVVGTVAGVEGNSLVFEGQGKLEFDFLILAVGIHFPALSATFGEDLATRVAFAKTFTVRVTAAKSILVGGGGPVALEVISECRRLNLEAKMTLVTSGDRLMGWTGQAAAKVVSRLKTKNIEVVYQERIQGNVDMSLESAKYTLASGRVIEADVFLPYFGQARTGFLAPELKGRGGRVIVNAKGQSPARPNIFAVGCGDSSGVSSGPGIDKEAKVVATNALALARGEEPLATLSDKPHPPPAYVHLGLGQYSAMNPSAMGVPTFCARCCGCCNPLCPCCACCGWFCGFPASELQGKFFKTVLTSGGNPFKLHAPGGPEIQRMD